MSDIYSFLHQGVLPEDIKKAKQVRMQAAKYVLVGDDMYKRALSTPLLKCLTTKEDNYVLRELHFGVCGLQSAAKEMLSRVLRAGYYWPTIRADCCDFVKKCVNCQKHGDLIHSPTFRLSSISSAWPSAT